ncbi:ABC transporter ATP-binding protein [Fundicoccus culcitae]|uniref:ABC transporter ATP-binding protein n=1 Tax=Fundicoccus culcitae TaxID=2969821 RepID=A0ABY5P595_9LACT|nr:ABC transporter ATP-binding protein [Fundicoccus culcitae]UUX33650.1 ABC transporter ATP-binding protein [Fundicoccus culcitae]
MVAILAQNDALIQLKNVNKYYQMGEQKLHVLKNIHLAFYANEFISIMGPSGSGKSTLVNIVGMLDNRFEGEYLLEGQAIETLSDNALSHRRNQMVGFVFQDFNLIMNMSVKENVRLPLIYHGMSGRMTQAPVEEILDKLEILDKMNHKPTELSGGQRQRVAIARALVNRPRFIIADEPTGALDTQTSRVIMDILAKMHQDEGVTVLLVTHDPSLQAYATRHVRIVDGQIREDKQTEANHTMIEAPTPISLSEKG